MRNKYRVAIIGCGKIGTFFSKPDDYNRVMTHAHAYKKDSRTELVAFVDHNKSRATKAAQIWGGNAYGDLDTMFKKERIDIVSICTPDESHADILKGCLLYRPKIVFCEKPLTTDFQIAKKIVKQYSDAGVLLAVNFARHWNPLIVDFKKQIKMDKYGKAINIVSVYTKGILHNGSHLIDILIYLFGDVSEAIPLAGRQDWHNRNDPTLDVFLRFKNGARAHIVAADERRYSIFDIDIYFDNARFILEDFSDRIIEYRIRDSIKASGYRELYKTGMHKGGNKRLILDGIKNLVNALEGKEELECSGKNALSSQWVCQLLIERYKKEKERWKN